jgi:hypothetical protein
MIPRAALFLLLAGTLHGGAADPYFVSAPGSPLKVPGGGHNLVLADLNDDRRPDLLVCGGTNLTLLFGNGHGGFDLTTNHPMTLPHGAGEMVLADFNRDGKLDWAAAHHEYYDVMVMLGKGGGEFTPVPGSPFIAREPGKRPHTHALATADLNRDGKLDLVTANNEDGDLSVLLGDGEGGFTRAPGSPFPCGPRPYPIALADLNLDGKVDVAVPNSGPGIRTITVLFGDGEGGFRPAPQSPFRAVGNVFFVTVADMNGDRKPDLIATHDESSLVTLLLGDGEGGFKPSGTSPLHLENWAWEILPIDLNGDGKLDLAAAGRNAVAVLIGDGRGGFRPVKGSPFRTGKGSWRLSLADLNSDGKLDIVAGNVESDDISVLLMR